MRSPAPKVPESKFRLAKLYVGFIACALVAGWCASTWLGSHQSAAAPSAALFGRTTHLSAVATRGTAQPNAHRAPASGGPSTTAGDRSPSSSVSPRLRAAAAARLAKPATTTKFVSVDPNVETITPASSDGSSSDSNPAGSSDSGSTAGS